MKVKISNVNIAIVVSNESGTQKVYNYFELHKKLKTTVKDDSGNVYLIPTYNELDANLWLQFDNFNIEAFEESIKDCDLSEVAMDKSINIFLQMLKCYDMTLEPKYLECCQRTAQYLLDSYPESITVLINYYQTIKRIRTLTKEEKSYLINLRNHTSDNCALACISIILDNITDYEYYFERLDDDTKSQFVKWPIYTMLHNHNDINSSLYDNNNELTSV